MLLSLKKQMISDALEEIKAPAFVEKWSFGCLDVFEKS